MEEQLKNINKTQEHKFNVTVAMEVGLNAATLFSRISHWVTDNEANEKNKKEGKYWTYDSRKSIIERMPYFTMDSLKRATQKLVDAEFIEVRLDLNRNSWDRTAWYTIGIRGFDPKVKIKKPSGKNPTTLNGNITNDYNTYKDTHIDLDLSKDKLGDEGSPKDNLIGITSNDNLNSSTPIEKERVIPIDSYNKFKVWVKTWSDKVGTTSHTVKSQEQTQQKNVWRMFLYTQEAFKGFLSFYDNYIEDLDEGWMKRNAITRENIIEASKKNTLKTLLTDYTAQLIKGQTVKDNNTHLVNKFDEFFLTEKVAPANEKGFVKKSLMLQWLCRSIRLADQKENKKELPIQRKHETHKSMYPMIDKLFGVNRKKLDKTTVDLQNQCIRLADALIDEIILKKLTLKEKRKTDKSIPKLPSYQINSLVNDFNAYHPTTEIYLKNWQLPRTFMPGRKSWNTFVDYLANKPDNKHEVKLFNIYKHDVIEYQG
jgi:hypothetical protein